jgi:hypothetical protein
MSRRERCQVGIFRRAADAVSPTVTAVVKKVELQNVERATPIVARAAPRACANHLVYQYEIIPTKDHDRKT